jgi:hypothetical protein
MTAATRASSRHLFLFSWLPPIFSARTRSAAHGFVFLISSTVPLVACIREIASRGVRMYLKASIVKEHERHNRACEPFCVLAFDNAWRWRLSLALWRMSFQRLC